MSNEAFEKTPKTQVKRLPERGRYDKDLAYRILDEGLICHVGIVHEGSPLVIPMAYGRDGNDILVHGSVASRLLKNMAKGIECCITVTLLDGLVLARSVFHHSMNYRSVVAFGRAVLIEDPAEKAKAFDQLVEKLIPGRSAEARATNPKESAATSILRMPLEEASIKVRTGPPSDHRDDLDMLIWAGVLPLHLETGEPLADEFTADEIPVPDYIRQYKRGD